VIRQLQATPSRTCGGTGTLPGPVDIKVTRIGGATQYATAEMIAELPPASNVGRAAFPGAYAGTNGSGGEGAYNATAGQGSVAPTGSTALLTGIVATGKGFQDAESASTTAYADRFPILLTTPSALSPEAASAIKALGLSQVIVMGGPLAVSDGVVSSLESVGVSVLRIGGQTYSATSTELATFETTGTGDGLGWGGTSSVAIARGNGFTDGLAGAVLAADGPSATSPEPLVLTLSPTSGGSALGTFLHAAGTAGIGGVRVVHLTVLGGPLAITTTTVAALVADL